MNLFKSKESLMMGAIVLEAVIIFGMILLVKPFEIVAGFVLAALVVSTAIGAALRWTLRKEDERSVKIGACAGFNTFLTVLFLVAGLSFLDMANMLGWLSMQTLLILLSFVMFAVFVGWSGYYSVKGDTV